MTDDRVFARQLRFGETPRVPHYRLLSIEALLVEFEDDASVVVVVAFSTCFWSEVTSSFPDTSVDK